MRRSRLWLFWCFSLYLCVCAVVVVAVVVVVEAYDEGDEKLQIVKRQRARESERVV